MRKLWPYILGIALIAGAIVVIILAVASAKNSDNHNTSGTAGSQTSMAAKPKQACGIFTLADAKIVLGADAKGGTNPIYENDGYINATSCTYSQDSGSNAPTAPVKSASLLVRVPKTAAAAASNRGQFGPLRPKEVQPVKGYGSSAYWDAQKGQLNILKNNTWYVLTNGEPSPADRDLDQAEQLADLLINKM